MIAIYQLSPLESNKTNFKMPREHPVYHIYAFAFMFCIANPQAFYSFACSECSRKQCDLLCRECTFWQQGERLRFKLYKENNKILDSPLKEKINAHARNEIRLKALTKHTQRCSAPCFVHANMSTKWELCYFLWCFALLHILLSLYIFSVSTGS